MNTTQIEKKLNRIKESLYEFKNQTYMIDDYVLKKDKNTRKEFVSYTCYTMFGERTEISEDFFIKNFKPVLQ